LASLARDLRRNATNAERRLWQGLRRNEIGGFRFRRQIALAGHIADFARRKARHRGGWLNPLDRRRACPRRRAHGPSLAAQGFAILRFTNDEVFHNLGGVLETVYRKLTELRPRIKDSAI
jgi:very-short-patch-repair endonuclease